MPEYEKVEIALENANAWLSALKNVDLMRFSAQLRDASVYALEQANNIDLPEENRDMYADEAGKLSLISIRLQVAHHYLDIARSKFIKDFGDTADPDWWIFRDDFLG